MIKLGFPKTGDLFSVEKTSSRFNVFRASLLYQEQNFPLIISLIDSLSAEYLALANFFLLIHRWLKNFKAILKIVKIRLGNRNSIPMLEAPSKQIYEIFLGKKEMPPTAKKKTNT